MIMLKLIDVESIAKPSYTTTLINNPVVYTNKNGASWIIRFVGDRTNIDFKLDPENKATAEIIAKIEASLFEGLSITVGVYEGTLYVFVGYMSTDDVMKEIERSYYGG